MIWWQSGLLSDSAPLYACIIFDYHIADMWCIQILQKRWKLIIRPREYKKGKADSFDIEINWMVSYQKKTKEKDRFVSHWMLHGNPTLENLGVAGDWMIIKLLLWCFGGN